MKHIYSKKKHLVMITIAFLCTLMTYSQVIITGVFDGPLPGGLPKGVELYVTENIPDLSIYSIGSANNGGGTDGEEFTFPVATASSGDFIYVASESVEFLNFFGFSPNYTNSAANINGDDAIELFKSGVVIDVFGDINVDGSGQSWEYLDGWAYRNNTTGPDGSSFVLANWSFSGANALDGETSNTSAAIPFPIGSYGSGGTVDNEAPSAPTNLIASNTTTTTADLSWSASIDNVGVTGYQIFNGVTLVASSVGTTYTVINLTPNTNYIFTVKAIDAAGNVSLESNEANVTTLEDVTSPTTSNLILSGIIDGPLSGGVPKAIEFFVVNDIADLSIYGFGSANNSGGTDGQEFTFSGSASAGDFIYVASEETGFTNFFGFAPNFTNGAANINGDDAIELFLNGNVVDVFGDINTDGSGQPWEYTDGWAYRNDNTGADGNIFVISNWTFSGPNALDGTTVNTTFPIGTYGGGDISEPLELISILEARGADNLGELVKVTGVLTVADQFSGAAYIQDTTGGIAIFDELVHGDGVFQVGDSITVTGTRSVFNDQVQISPVTEVENNGIPNQPIEPLVITLNELANHPAELVKVLNPSFPKPGDIFFGDSNYVLTDSSGSGELRIDNDVEAIAGLGQPETCDEVVGVVGRFFEVYQLLPRMTTDISCAGAYMPPMLPIEIPKEQTLDVVTWNIEWFGDESNSPAAGNPMSDAIQKDSVKTVINKLKADVFAVQEISDDALFAQLVSEIPGYDFILSPAVSRPNDSGVKQKVGFIYNTATINVTATKVLLESIHPLYNGGDDSALVNYPNTTDRFYASGRLPFLMTADVTIEGETEQYNFIALHARANSSSDPQSRYDMRKYDVEVLKDSLDVQYATANIVLLGDYNDDVDVTVADVSTTLTSYDDYVTDTTNYNIVTSALSAAGFRSFVSRENMIDHIAISNELNDNYINESERVHYEFYDSDYTRTTSDHFPVSARLQLKALHINEVVYTDVTCFGASDGTATITVSGGIAPYRYEWDGSDMSSNTMNGLTSGSHTVIITDALGSAITEEFTISEPPALEVTTTGDTTVYFGYPSQACTLLEVTNVVGGVAPYTYEWSTGETQENIEVCPEETTTYSVTVTDANGCTEIATIEVTAIDVVCKPRIHAYSNWRHQSNRKPKVQVCYRGRVLCVNQHRVETLLARGAYLGACSNDDILPNVKIKVLPNPFVDYTHVVLNSNVEANVELSIYDFYRQLLKSSSHQINAGKSNIRLELSDLRCGFYYLKTKINGKNVKTKVLVKRYR